MEPIYKYISQLANAQRRFNEKHSKGKPYTGSQGKVIHYLLTNRHRPVYQKDIEYAFGLRPASATNLIKSLEGMCWVERVTSSTDGRLKEIKLTDSAGSLEKDVISGIEELVSVMTEDIDDDLLDSWIATTLMMLENLKRAVE